MNSPTRASLTGPQLQALRRDRRISQSAMGQLIGCSRHAVSYWETKLHRIKTRYGVPARMLEALGRDVLPINWTSTRTRGDGVLLDAAQAALDREAARIDAKAQARAARYRQPCQAQTRKGHPCRNKSEAGRRRCKFHGGKSTGPKTAQGKASIATAQRRRWAAYRLEKNQRKSKPLGV